MHLGITSVGQVQLLYVPVSLMLSHVVSQSYDYRFVEGLSLTARFPGYTVVDSCLVPKNAQCKLKNLLINCVLLSIKI